MDDLRCADVDFLTIGQYLQPTPKHHPVVSFWRRTSSGLMQAIAKVKGFLLVSAIALDALVASRGRGFRQAQGRAPTAEARTSGRERRHRNLTLSALSFEDAQVSNQTHRVAHAAKEMFDLVADVEAYPKFLPFAGRSAAARGAPDGDGRTSSVADMEVGYKAVRETLHQPRDLRSAKNAKSSSNMSTGRSSISKINGVSSSGAERLHRRIRHRL